MPSIEDPLFLLPDGSSNSSVYFCMPVDPELSQRSAFVAGLMDTAGLAALPGGVTQERFLFWYNLQMDAAAMSRQPVAKLTKVLQVSDKMGDTATPKIAEAIARFLKQVDWDVPSANSTQQLVLTLPQTLQGLVFKHVADIMCIDDILGHWPLAMQLAYFDGAVSAPPHEYSVSGRTGPLSEELAMLARTAPSSPGLKSLTLNEPAHSPLSSSAATLATAVLVHHATSLSALTLPSLSLEAAAGPDPADGEEMPSAALQILSTIPQLTHLTRLTLMCRRVREGSQAFQGVIVSPDAAAAFVNSLVAALEALPTLACVSLCDLAISVAPGSICKRRKLASSAGAASKDAAVSLDPVIAALSTAPALTSLTLATFLGGHTPVLPCSSVSGPFTSLRRLHLHHNMQLHAGPEPRFSLRSVDNSWSGSELPWNVAPMPLLRHLTVEGSSNTFDGPDLAEMVETAALQEALRTVSFRFRHSRNEDLLSICVLNQLTQVTEVSLLLQPSERLHISTIESAVKGLGKLTALQSLDLELRGPANGTDTTDDDVEFEGDAEDALLPLRDLTNLQQLRIVNRSEASDGFIVAFRDALAACGLSTFRRLTCLQLQVDGNDAAPSEILMHLSSLTGLRTLEWSSVGSSLSNELWACLTPLTALRQLSVSLCFFDLGSCFELVGCLGGMQQLVQFKLRTVGGAGCRGWACALDDLPERSGVLYSFDCGSKNARVGKAEYERLKCELAAKGGTVRRCPGTNLIEVSF